MDHLTARSSSPLVLLLALVAGAAAGQLYPSEGAHLAVVGQVYIAVINMAALPLLVVAIFFGLRQVLLTPRSGVRLIRLIGTSIGFMLLCTLIGLVAATALQSGRNLSESELQYLGMVVQGSGDGASNVDVLLNDVVVVPLEGNTSAFSVLISNNYFKSLANGDLLNILVGALIFGAGFALHKGRDSVSLMRNFEALYRALEVLILSANRFIPLLVFCTAAIFVGSVDRAGLNAMGSFFGAFFGAVVLLAVLSFALLCRRTGMPPWKVLSALKTPALISLTSASAVAAIPDTIHAMSAKLGFSRGLTEFIVPLASIFLRCGSAVYFSVLVVFVVNMYGRPMGVTEGLLICGGAMLGAYASAGRAGAATLAFMGMALSPLQLPLEAIVPMFLAIEVLCEGPRSFLSFLAVCTLVALTSDGLPSQKSELEEATQIESGKTTTLTFSATDLIVAIVCLFLVMLLVMSVGVGLGMR